VTIFSSVRACFLYQVWAIRSLETLVVKKMRQITGRWDENDIYLSLYNEALFLETILPGRSLRSLRGLFDVLDALDKPGDWKSKRRARLYFYIGRLVRNRSRKIRYLQECLSLMPEHYDARQLLHEITGE